VLLWFLNLFPQYRDAVARAADTDVIREERDGLMADADTLRQANTELTTEKLLLEDRLQSALDDKQQLWDLVKDSLHGERYALQTQVNHATQRHGGGIPYPDANALPAHTVRTQEGGPIGPKRRLLPSQAGAMRTRKYIMEELIPDLEAKARAAGIPVVDPPGTGQTQ